MYRGNALLGFIKKDDCINIYKFSYFVQVWDFYIKVSIQITSVTENETEIFMSRFLFFLLEYINNIVQEEEKLTF